MNPESQQQIAREAAERLWYHEGSDREQMNYQIILSAIERATASVPDGMLSGGVQKMDAAAQPQRSDQQEWTPELVHDLFRDNEDWNVKIARAHNASLTAERQRREQEKDEHDSKILSYITTHQADVNYNSELKRQLLSALAAIEKKDETLRTMWEHLPQFTCALQRPSGDHKGYDVWLHDFISEALNCKVDLSLLHEHDAETYAKGAQHQHKEDELVRKPLLDALRKIRKLTRGGCALPSVSSKAIMEVINDALAKVKQ